MPPNKDPPKAGGHTLDRLLAPSCSGLRSRVRLAGRGVLAGADAVPHGLPGLGVAAPAVPPRGGRAGSLRPALARQVRGGWTQEQEKEGDLC